MRYAVSFKALQLSWWAGTKKKSRNFTVSTVGRLGEVTAGLGSSLELDRHRLHVPADQTSNSHKQEEPSALAILEGQGEWTRLTLYHLSR